MKQTRSPLGSITVLVAMLAGIATAGAQQWTALRPPVAGVDLHGLFFFDGDSGFVCGRRGVATGVLYSTADGGLSWSLAMLPGSPSGLNDICFAGNGTFGAVAGDAGYLAVTTDRGASWSQRSIGTGTWSGGGDVEAVYFRTREIGFAVGRALVGNGPRFARTTDAGLSWSNVPLSDPPANNLYDLDFFDSLHALAVGTGSPPRRSLTSDGGARWESAATLSIGAGESGDSKSIYGVDAVAGTSIAYAAGGRNYGPIASRYAEVRRSVDYGRSWTATTMSGDAVSFNQPASDVLALSGSLVYVAAQQGRLYRSNDSGQTWSRETLPSSVRSTHDLRRFHHAADNTILLAGTGGILLSARLVPDVAFSRDTIDFAIVCPGTATTDIVRIGNAGSGVLMIDSTSITGAVQPGVTFSTDLVPSSVSAGGSSPLRVRVTVAATAAPGLYRATLRVRTSDENYTGRDTLRLIPLVARVGTRSFTLDNAVARDAGRVRFGGAFSSDLQLARILRSSGECPVTTTAIALVRGSDYIIQSFSPATYRPGDHFSIGLFFVPTRGCRRDDTLLVFFDGAGSPIRIPITGTGTEPSYRTLPRDTVDFGRVLLGASSSQTLRLLNSRSGLCLDSTMISRISLLGTGRLSFGVGRVAPPAFFLPADGEATVDLTATPATLGVTTAFLTIAHDVASLPIDTVWLRVEGVRPELVTAGAAISWGRTMTGGGGDSLVRSFLQNRGGVVAEIVGAAISGPDAASFRYVAPATPFSIAVGAVADLRVGFRPTRVGTHDARLTLDALFPDGSGRQIIVPLSGTSASAQIATLRGEIVYPTTPVNRCEDTTLVRFIYNRGPMPLVIRSLVSRADPGGLPADSLAFRIVSPVLPPSQTIAPGDSLSIAIQFCPKRSGYHQARLLIGNNTAGADSQFAVMLRGNGRSSSFTNISEIRFAPTRVLTTRDSTVLGFLFNDQPGELVIDSIRILGGLDSISFRLLSFSNSFSIAPGRNVPIRVRFAPLRRGYHETFLYVYAAGAQTPYQVVLAGTAIYPFLRVAPADPGSLRIRPGSSRRVRIDLINAGDDSARVERLQFSGPAVFTNPTTGPLPSTLMPGDTLPLFVDVAPDRLCAIDGRVSIRAEGVRGVYALADTVVTISAVGVMPALGTRRAEILLGPAPPGVARDSVLGDFLGNLDFTTGLFDCVDNTTIDSMTISGGDAALFELLSPVDPLVSRPVSAGAFQPLSLRFTPAVPGRFRSTLRIFSEGRVDTFLSVDLVGVSSTLPVEFAGAVELDFGAVPIGESRDSTLRIVNRSADPLLLEGVAAALSSEGFTVVSPTSGVTIVAGESATVQVRFAPVGAPGFRRSALEIRTATTVDSTFSLRGSAVRDNLTAGENGIDFGRRAVGSIVDTVVTLFNRAGTSIPDPGLIDTAVVDEIVLLSPDGAFVLLSPLLSLPPGAADSIGIRFDASAPLGTRSARLMVYHNRRVESGRERRDSLLIPLSGIVGDSTPVGLGLGDDIFGSPGDRIVVPLRIDGDLAAADLTKLELRLGFNPRQIRPLSVRSRQTGVTIDLLEDRVRFPLGDGRILRIDPPFSLEPGIVAELELLMLLGDVLTSEVTLSAANVESSGPGLPGFASDTILVTSDFCEADARRVLIGGSGILKLSPHPAGDQVTIEIETAAAGTTTLSLFDPLGQEIARPLDAELPAGISSHSLDLSAVPEGLYLVVLRTGLFRFTTMMQVAR